MVGGFFTAGVPGVMWPLYSNVGTCLLVLHWPVAALVVTLALVLWAVGMCLVGFAAQIGVARRASPQDSQS